MLTHDWDLTHFYKTEELVEQDLNKIKEIMSSLKDFKGKLNNKDKVLEYFKRREELLIIETKVAAYLELREALDGKDVFARKMIADYESCCRRLAPELSFIEPELAKNRLKDLKLWKQDKDFEKYNLDLLDVIENRKHVLSEKVAGILSVNGAWGGYAEIFTKLNDVDLKFGRIKTSEGEEELTHASYYNLIKNKDRKIRKKTYEQFHSKYKELNYTLGSVLLNEIKETVFHSKISKYKSVLEEVCKNDRSDIKVLPKLIKIVDKNIGLMHRKYRLHKKAIGLKDYYSYDTFVDVGNNEDQYPYEKGVRMVCDALSVMGDEYLNIIKKATTEGWIDVYEKDAKCNSEFAATGIFGVHPYVLLNYKDNFMSVNTLAHELGHLAHSYYSDTTQPITKCSAPVFTAEVASIVNEIILNKYMMNNAKSKNEKLFYLNHLIVEFCASVFVQVMYSEFEQYVYSNIENMNAILVEDLNNKWADLLKKYHGNEVKMSELAKYFWSEIPHLYTSYYVYKYASGYIAATIIAKNLMDKKEGYLNKYINFLKSGCSRPPIDLLKEVDVDLLKEDTLQSAFDYLETLLDEYEKLTKE